MINHHYQSPIVPYTFQTISQILNAVSYDILKVIMTNRKASEARIKPIPGLCGVRLLEGNRATNVITPTPRSPWMDLRVRNVVAGRGQDLGQERVFGKESARALGPRWDLITLE